VIDLVSWGPTATYRGTVSSLAIVRGVRP